MKLLSFLFILFLCSSIEYRPLIYDIHTEKIEHDTKLILTFKTDVPSYTNIYIFSEQYKKDYDLADINDPAFDWWFKERIVSPYVYQDIFNNVITFNEKQGILFYISYKYILYTVDQTTHTQTHKEYYRYFHGSCFVDNEKKQNHNITITVDPRIRYLITIAASENLGLQCYTYASQQEFNICIQNNQYIDESARCLLLYGDSGLPLYVMYNKECSEFQNIKTIPIILQYESQNEEIEGIIEEKEPNIIDQIVGFIIAGCFIIILILIGRKINKWRKR